MTELVLEDADRWLQVSLERRRTPPGVKYGTDFFLGRKSPLVLVGKSSMNS